MIILSNEGITKALSRLGGCAGWSVPLLFPNPKDMFSRFMRPNYISDCCQIIMFVCVNALHPSQEFSFMSGCFWQCSSSDMSPTSDP